MLAATVLCGKIVDNLSVSEEKKNDYFFFFLTDHTPECLKGLFNPLTWTMDLKILKTNQLCGLSSAPILKTKFLLQWGTFVK